MNTEAGARWSFAPRRIRGSEHLDDPTLDPALALRSLHDVRRSNRLLGGTGAVLYALRRHLDRANGTSATLVDVGTGLGDIPFAVRRLAQSGGVTVRTTGLEWTVPLAAAARSACEISVAGDARMLPFADRSVDIVTCSQVLHHFARDEAIEIVREMHRVARRCVVIGDLRRSWLAAGGVWLASWPMAFHPVSRHDGVVSVLRGFLAHELREIVVEATGITPVVHERPMFRVTADWSVA